MENYASLSKFGDKQAQIYVGYENQGYVGHAMTNIMSKEVFGMDFTDMLKATTGDADPEKKAQLQSKLMKFTNKDNMTDATGTFQDMFSSTSPELVNAVRGMSGNTYGEDDMQEKTLDSMEGLREELAKLTKTISDATRTRNISDRGRQIDSKQWVD